MPTAENAKLQYEAGQTSYAMSALSDSGDNTTFTGSASFWSRRSGYAPVVRPNGLITGGEVTPAASGTNNMVDVAAGTAYINGALVTFSADTDVEITRATSTDTHMINSITVTSAGAVAAVTGTDHASAFSETRAADGGPPLIATTSIEIAQVRTTSFTAAAITAAEIFSVVGTHTERYDYPLWEVNYGDGSTNAGVTFTDALPDIHTGTVPKGVYASYADPIFANVQKSVDFVPPENSHTVNSTQIYGQTLGSTSTSLNQGSFTAYLEDGVDDALVSLKDEFLWFRFYPDRTQSPYILCHGKLGVTRSFPAGDSISAACTINAEEIGSEVSA